MSSVAKAIAADIKRGSMSTHTDGPWFAWKDGIYCGTPTEKNSTYVCGFDAQICSMSDEFNKRDLKAITRLITAAPDMLAALQMAKHIVANEGTFEQADQVFDAIEKATGKPA